MKLRPDCPEDPRGEGENPRELPQKAGGSPYLRGEPFPLRGRGLYLSGGLTPPTGRGLYLRGGLTSLTGRGPYPRGRGVYLRGGLTLLCRLASPASWALIPPALFSRPPSLQPGEEGGPAICGWVFPPNLLTPPSSPGGRGGGREKRVGVMRVNLGFPMFRGHRKKP